MSLSKAQYGGLSYDDHLKNAIAEVDRVNGTEAGYVKPRRKWRDSHPKENNEYITAVAAADHGLLRPKVQIDPDERGSIHLNFRLMKKINFGPLRIARTIIHEASHKFANTMDHAYADETNYKSLSRNQMLINADSYAYIAICLARATSYKDDLDIPSSE
jgi:hypothetical protein